MEIPLIVGGGLVVIGVGIGIGQIGKGAMEGYRSSARNLAVRYRLRELFLLH